MIVQIIDEFGQRANIVASMIETFGNVDLIDGAGNTIPGVRVGLTSGRSLISQHDTTNEFRERLQAARGGPTLHIHGHSDQKIATFGDLGQVFVGLGNNSGPGTSQGREQTAGLEVSAKAAPKAKPSSRHG